MQLISEANTLLGRASFGPKTSARQESGRIHSRLRVTRDSQRVAHEDRSVDRARTAVPHQIGRQVQREADLVSPSVRNERAPARRQTIQSCVADRGLFLQKRTLAAHVGQIRLRPSQTPRKQEVSAKGHWRSSDTCPQLSSDRFPRQAGRDGRPDHLQARP